MKSLCEVQLLAFVGLLGCSVNGSQGVTFAPDAATALTVSATIGPAGGTLDLRGGVQLIVPRGALPSGTTISGTLGNVPSALWDIQNEGRLTFIVAFEPNGLVLGEPAQLIVPIAELAVPPLLPNDDPAFFSVGDEPQVPAEEEGDSQFEILPSIDQPAAYAVEVSHFSSVGAQWLGKGVSLDEVAKCSGVAACKAVWNRATEKTYGVSADVRKKYVASSPGHLFQIKPNPRLQSNAYFPFLISNDAVEDLDAAANDLKEKKLILTAAWRSLPAAYVIWRARANSGSASETDVAAPGKTRHHRGAAIDIHVEVPDVATCQAELKRRLELHADEDVRRIEDADITDPRRVAALGIVAPEVGEALERHHFRWNGCSDQNHFNWTGDTADSSANGPANQAFQELWNFNNPCYEIVVNGVVGDCDSSDTCKALGKSPSQGFDHTTKKDLPSDGVTGAGCQLKPDEGAVCCPGVGGTSPSCMPSCDQCDVNPRCALQQVANPDGDDNERPWTVVTCNCDEVMVGVSYGSGSLEEYLPDVVDGATPICGRASDLAPWRRAENIDISNGPTVDVICPSGHVVRAVGYSELIGPAPNPDQLDGLTVACGPLDQVSQQWVPNADIGSPTIVIPCGPGQVAVGVAYKDKPNPFSDFAEAATVVCRDVACVASGGP